MPVSARAEGTTIQGDVVDVSARTVLAFAAALDHTEAAFFDDAGAGRVPAPPAFCAALEWPLLSGPLRFECLGISSDEQRRAVHVWQDSTFHSVIRVGDRLRTCGRIASIRETRAGALVRTSLTTVDAMSGAAVVTTDHATIYRGVRVNGGETPPATSQASRSPEAFPHERRIVTGRGLPHVYSECSGIWNPIHTERRVALAAGLPDIILHGSLTWALAGRELLRACTDGDPARLRRLRARFVSPVVAGTALTLRYGSANAEGELAFEVETDDGRVALADGLAVLPPNPAGRRG
ncbi:MAG: MaoC/PaaZ C-terminal domain-containing protein [Vicinamibacterales bacterium]